jgi:uncharacterized protein
VRPVFQELGEFRPEDGYTLLPFQFADIGGKKIVVNVAGEHEIIPNEAFRALVDRSLPAQSDLYQDLKSKHFLYDGEADTPVRLLATKLRTKYQFLAEFTRLHIFVVTLRCDHSCQYCQVSRVSASKSKYDMSIETADHAIGLLFRAPARRVKVEFQGGEPLLNFELIEHVVETIEAWNVTLPQEARKDVEFVIATNLGLLTDRVLAFCRDHAIYLSTSLDGPASIHNVNRPRPGRDAHQRTIDGLGRARAVLGHDAVSALMTTTRLSLDQPETIVDEYASHGFDHIFVRPISPYGFAVKSNERTGYDKDQFLVFYKRALARIIEINRSRTPMVEIYAQILLRKILTPYSTSYVDLQSPSGAAIGAVVYNYDGDVYASDEGRMLAEMGDKTFKIGSVSDSFESIFGGAQVRSLVMNSINVALPGCSDCAYQSWCGTDPVENHALQGDVVGHRPTSEFCRRNMGIITHLLELLHGDDAFVRDLFQSWAFGVPLNAFDDISAADE